MMSVCITDKTGFPAESGSDGKNRCPHTGINGGASAIRRDASTSASLIDAGLSPQLANQNSSCRTSNKIPSAGQCKICSIEFAPALVSVNPVRQLGKFFEIGRAIKRNSAKSGGNLTLYRF